MESRPRALLCALTLQNPTPAKRVKGLDVEHTPMWLHVLLATKAIGPFLPLLLAERIRSGFGLLRRVSTSPVVPGDYTKKQSRGLGV